MSRRWAQAAQSLMCCFRCAFFLAFQGVSGHTSHRNPGVLKMCVCGCISDVLVFSFGCHQHIRFRLLCCPTHTVTLILVCECVTLPVVYVTGQVLDTGIGLMGKDFRTLFDPMKTEGSSATVVRVCMHDMTKLTVQSCWLLLALAARIPKPCHPNQHVPAALWSLLSLHFVCRLQTGRSTTALSS
jgi:hypothetical protein